MKNEKNEYKKINKFLRDNIQESKLRILRAEEELELLRTSSRIIHFKIRFISECGEGWDELNHYDGFCPDFDSKTWLSIRTEWDLYHAKQRMIDSMTYLFQTYRKQYLIERNEVVQFKRDIESIVKLQIRTHNALEEKEFNPDLYDEFDFQRIRITNKVTHIIEAHQKFGQEYISIQKKPLKK
jgi:hypothetical protein